MKKIKYEYDKDYHVITDCPFGAPHKVGTINCVNNCRYNRGYNGTDKYVKCNYDESHPKKK